MDIGLVTFFSDREHLNAPSQTTQTKSAQVTFICLAKYILFTEEWGIAYIFCISKEAGANGVMG